MSDFFRQDIIISQLVSVTSADSRAEMSYFFERPHHALIYKVSGVMRCFFADREIEFTRNDIVYIPKGMTYRSMASSDPPGRYIIINFDTLGDFPADEIQVARFENHSNLYSLFSKCADEWLFKDSAHLLSCRSYTYKILALMARALDGSDASIRAKIQPALEFMRRRIDDPALTPVLMAEAAGLSEVQFRRLFKSVFLVSPSRYVTSVRVGQAKELLRSDGASAEYLTVQEVARAVGFADVDSFSRSFRREVGMSPGAWREMS